MRVWLAFALLMLFLSLLSHPSALGAPLLCQKTWGGNNHDDGRALAIDSSGNIYITGNSASFRDGIPHVPILKYSPSCNLLWQRIWGGNDTDIGHGVAVDSTGNIYVAGSTRSFNVSTVHNENLFLLKFNTTGNLVWQTVWGDNVHNSFARGVSVDSSGNIILTGSTSSFGAGHLDVIILKFNSTGGLLWQETWGGAGYDEGLAVTVDASNRIDVTGSTTSFGAGFRDVFLLQLSAAGDLLWQRTWGGTLNETGRGLAVDSAGNIYVTGSTNSGSELYNAILLKFDSAGTLVWQRTWGGRTFDEGLGVALDPAGSIYLTGTTNSSGAGSDDVFLLRFNPSGDLTGKKMWGGINSDEGLGIAVDSTGNAVVTGFVSEAPPYILSSPSFSAGTPLFAVSDNGNSTLGIPNLLTRSAAGTVSTPSGIETYGGLSDIFVLKYGPSIFILVPTFPFPIAILALTALARAAIRPFGGKLRRARLHLHNSSPE